MKAISIVVLATLFLTPSNAHQTKRNSIQNIEWDDKGITVTCAQSMDAERDVLPLQAAMQRLFAEQEPSTVSGTMKLDAQGVFQGVPTTTAVVTFKRKMDPLFMRMKPDPMAVPVSLGLRYIFERHEAQITDSEVELLGLFAEQIAQIVRARAPDETVIPVVVRTHPEKECRTFHVTIAYSPHADQRKVAEGLLSDGQPGRMRRGIKLLQRLAAHGDWQSQARLGDLYRDGLLLKEAVILQPNLSRAKECYEEAIKCAYSRGQRNFARTIETRLERLMEASEKRK